MPGQIARGHEDVRIGGDPPTRPAGRRRPAQSDGAPRGKGSDHADLGQRGRQAGRKLSSLRRPREGRQGHRQASGSASPGRAAAAPLSWARSADRERRRSGGCRRTRSPRRTAQGAAGTARSPAPPSRRAAVEQFRRAPGPHAGDVTRQPVRPPCARALLPRVIEAFDAVRPDAELDEVQFCHCESPFPTYFVEVRGDSATDCGTGRHGLCCLVPAESMEPPP